MKLFLQLLQKNNRMPIVLLMCYGLGLLLWRAKITHSLYLFFLIWNLVLAVVPFGLSVYLKNKFNLVSKPTKWILCGLWLVFLPNAFYIITDFVHLIHSSEHLFYVDVLIISTGALLGFFFGFASLHTMEQLFVHQLKLVTPLLCLLCGYGVYVGRELRFNSWDVIVQPFRLFGHLAQKEIFIESAEFSIFFGAFLYLLYQLYKHFHHDKITIL